jgi:hypothetical protein
VEVGLCIALGLMAMVATAGYFSPPSRAKRRARRTERALAARRRSWIAEAHGPVRVTGRIHRDAKLLEAPLSGRPCVVYELVVDELSSGSLSSGSPSLWRRLLDLRQTCPFLLEDDSGTARIDPAGPGFVALVHDHVGVTSGVYPGNHLALRTVLESCGLLPMTWRGRWMPLRYAEGVLAAGELVTVGGNAAREIDQGGDSPSLRSPPRRLVIRGSEAEPLLITSVRTDPPDPNRQSP